MVICTRNRPEDLSQCLEAVKRWNYPRFEVLVVDYAPADERARGVAGRWGARYTVEPVVGLSRARNRVARNCWRVMSFSTCQRRRASAAE